MIKKIAIVIIALFVLGLIVSFFEDNTVKRPQKKMKTEVAELSDQEILERELKSFEKPFDSTNFRESAELIFLEVAMFQGYKKVIDDTADNQDVKVKELNKKLRTKVSALQVSEFPKMRKAYVKVMKDKMWVHDIDVVGSGKLNENITITGIAFLSNSSIQTVQTDMQEIFDTLRFKRINYKGYKNIDEYNYYTLKTLNDADI